MEIIDTLKMKKHSPRKIRIIYPKIPPRLFKEKESFNTLSRRDLPRRWKSL